MQVIMHLSDSAVMHLSFMNETIYSKRLQSDNHRLSGKLGSVRVI